MDLGVLDQMNFAEAMVVAKRALGMTELADVMRAVVSEYQQVNHVSLRKYLERHLPGTSTEVVACDTPTSGRRGEPTGDKYSFFISVEVPRGSPDKYVEVKRLLSSHGLTFDVVHEYVYPVEDKERVAGAGVRDRRQHVVDLLDLAQGRGQDMDIVRQYLGLAKSTFQRYRGRYARCRFRLSHELLLVFLCSEEAPEVTYDVKLAAHSLSLSAEEQQMVGHILRGVTLNGAEAAFNLGLPDQVEADTRSLDALLDARAMFVASGRTRRAVFEL